MIDAPTPDELTALLRQRATLIEQLVALDVVILRKQRENIQGTVASMLTGPYIRLNDRITDVASAGVNDAEALHTLYLALTERVNALSAEVLDLHTRMERAP